MRLIDADDFGNRMYHEAFEKDTDMQRWDSGCWIRYKLFENVLREQPTVQPEPQWIPCSERLPEIGQAVICQCRAGIINVMKLDSDRHWFIDPNHLYMQGFVIAWMPLPDSYKEEKT